VNGRTEAAAEWESRACEFSLPSGPRKLAGIAKLADRSRRKKSGIIGETAGKCRFQCGTGAGSLRLGVSLFLAEDAPVGAEWKIMMSNSGALNEMGLKVDGFLVDQRKSTYELVDYQGDDGLRFLDTFVPPACDPA
jgi:hypothetical protein